MVINERQLSPYGKNSRRSNRKPHFARQIYVRQKSRKYNRPRHCEYKSNDSSEVSSSADSADILVLPFLSKCGGCGCGSCSRTNTEIDEEIDFEKSVAVPARDIDTVECVPICAFTQLHEANESEFPVKGLNDILFSGLKSDGESYVC